MEKILVLGNGFDIAHGLPTKYCDFLKFLDVIENIINQEGTCGYDVYIDNQLQQLDAGLATVIKEKAELNEQESGCGHFISHPEIWKELLHNNCWISIFRNKKRIIGDGWIDFEAEIANVIREIDVEIEKAKKEGISLNKKIELSPLIQFFPPNGHELTEERIVKKLLSDLNNVKRLLELYLSEYVEHISTSKRIADIEDYNPTKVISFNYTNTYKRLYGNKSVVYDYYHGIADASRSKEDNNMVLGIDEYLPDDKKNTDLLFVEFKKFYQRQYLGIIRKSEDWCKDLKDDAECMKIVKEYLSGTAVQLKLINNDNVRMVEGSSVKYFELLLREEISMFDSSHPKHEIVFYGHSLGITDKDLIRMLIENDNVHVRIYYHSKEAYSAQIKNLIRIIGQDELNSRTAGRKRTIEFVKTQGNPS